jgi:hypothetical protein
VFTVTIQEGCRRIGEFAFAYCSALSQLDLPIGLETIGGSAFFECKRLKDLTIPRGCTSIGERAFFNCQMAKISVPKDCVTRRLAFWNCAARVKRF